MINRGIRTTIAGPTVVAELSLRMQYRRPTLGAPINEFRPTEYAVIMFLENVREITATRAKAVLIVQLRFACQRHLGEPMGTILYDIAFENPRVKPATKQVQEIPQRGEVLRGLAVW